jgi:hypothetical protein
MRMSSRQVILNKAHIQRGIVLDSWYAACFKELAHSYTVARLCWLTGNKAVAREMFAVMGGHSIPSCITR